MVAIVISNVHSNMVLFDTFYDKNMYMNQIFALGSCNAFFVCLNYPQA